MGKNDGKIMKKKNEKFPISCLKWVKLYSTHNIQSEKNEKMPWGCPWECKNWAKMAKFGIKDNFAEKI